MTARRMTVLALGLLLSTASRLTGQCQEAKLLAPDGDNRDDAGSSVAVAGDFVVVGAQSDADRGHKSGSAWVYRFDGRAWAPEAKLLAPDGEPNDRFGYASAADGPVIIVSAIGDDHEDCNGCGSVHVYRGEGGKWTHEAKLLGSAPRVDDNFGKAVALRGDRALIASRNRAYVFRYDGTAWHEEARLDPENINGFGKSVGLDGDRAIVGAQTNAGEAGTAVVYEYDGSTWVETIRLLPSDGTTGQRFGTSVAIDGDLAVVGALSGNFTGAAYAFRRTGKGWTEDAKLGVSEEERDGYGRTVAISGAVAVVGATMEGIGRVQVYRRAPDAWEEQPRLHAADGALDDFFGGAVAIDGDSVVVAARGESARGQSAGAAYVFRHADPIRPDCNANGTCDANDIASGFSFDCNGNNVPDECDIDEGWSEDCNENGVPDECDPSYAIDDGQVDRGVGCGTGEGCTSIWINRFVVRPDEETIVAIALTWGAVEEGRPGTVMLYRDPNGDGDPTDAVLLATAPTWTPATWWTDGVHPIGPTVVGAPGDSFFVGVALPHCDCCSCSSMAPAGLDDTAPRGESWFIDADADEFDLEDLANNANPPVRVAAYCCDGNFTLCAVPATIPCGDCVADLDGSGDVDFEDLLRVLDAWGPCDECPEDLDEDGGVGLGDLLIVLGAWGPCE